MQQHQWYKEFFNGLAVEMWHQAVPSGFTEGEVSFIVQTIQSQNGARILDVCCGSGRIAVALAARGFNVTGIDISGENIALLRNLSAGLSVQSICADVLDYDFAEMYDHAVCMGNSFSYFDRDGMLAFCRNIFRALMPGGRFLINTGALAESLLPALKDTTTMEVQDILFTIRNEYLAAESLLKTDMKFQRREEVEEKTAYHFVYTAAEITRILNESGFGNVKIYGDTKGSAFQLRDPNAYIVAEK